MYGGPLLKTWRASVYSTIRDDLTSHRGRSSALRSVGDGRRTVLTVGAVTVLPLTAMDEEQALEALSNVISALSETPFDLSLHAQHIQLAVASGMDDQVRAARDTLTAYYACGDDVWLPLLEDKKSTADLDTVEGALSVLTAYKRAEDDYLCTHSL